MGSKTVTTHLPGRYNFDNHMRSPDAVGKHFEVSDADAYGAILPAETEQ